MSFAISNLIGECDQRDGRAVFLSEFGFPMIRFDSNGFSLIKHDGAAQHVPWASVKEVFTFKLDLVTYDTIRLGLRVSEDGEYWQVDEDDVGFQELLTEIERRFGIRDKEWWTKVAFPAFATNRTTLWGEPWTGESRSAVRGD